MSWSDGRILLQLLRGQPRHGTHAERLQSFYAPQAHHYDAFRERLLRGRRELLELLAPPPGAHVIELGGGTGRNLLYFGAALQQLGSVEIVDLCPALLSQARQRANGLANVRVVEADAVHYRPARSVDCVYFSYALTMIPDWRGALDNALAMLKPGGTLGVVDFYVSPRHPPVGSIQHGALTRLFWPHWFAHDGVHLNPEHLPTLRQLLPQHACWERRAPVPYLPGVRVPYYLFVGHRPAPSGV